MVEQTSAGTRNLSEETVHLVTHLRRFRVDPDPARRSCRESWLDADSFAEAARASRPPVPAKIRSVTAHALASGPALDPAFAPAFEGNTALRARLPAPTTHLDSDDWSEF